MPSRIEPITEESGLFVPTKRITHHASMQSLGKQSEVANIKKKRRPLFNFLSLKEPSAKALAEMEERMKRNGKIVDGRINPVGMGNTASKLPVTAPDVHSRWDGIPKVLKSQQDRPKAQGAVLTSSASIRSEASSNSSRSDGTRSSTRTTRSSTTSSGSYPRHHRLRA